MFTILEQNWSLMHSVITMNTLLFGVGKGENPKNRKCKITISVGICGVNKQQPISPSPIISTYPDSLIWIISIN